MGCGDTIRYMQTRNAVAIRVRSLYRYESWPHRALGNRAPQEFALAAGACVGGKTEGMPETCNRPSTNSGDPQVDHATVESFFRPTLRPGYGGLRATGTG